MVFVVEYLATQTGGATVNNIFEVRFIYTPRNIQTKQYPEDSRSTYGSLENVVYSGATSLGGQILNYKNHQMPHGLPFTENSRSTYVSLEKWANMSQLIICALS